MNRTGEAVFPLHGGRAPRWLFERMMRLSRAVVAALVEHGGPETVLARLSDPFWFQTFGCLLGFDWHSGGITTTVCGALKHGLQGTERELGLLVAGGKGKASRKTPQELANFGTRYGIDAETLLREARQFTMPTRHTIHLQDLDPTRLFRIFLHTYEAQATTFEGLLGLPKVGARTLRALALLSELLAGAPSSWRDPARFSVAHGGKDGIPLL